MLTDASLGFECAYEKRELYDTFAAATEAHVENLRVQGLYMPLDKACPSPPPPPSPSAGLTSPAPA